MAQASWLGPKVGIQQPPGAVLHSSPEPSELSQWLCHDDSTVNIVMIIIISIIIIIINIIIIIISLSQSASGQ